MMRKMAVVTMLLLVVGLAPLGAVIGFCSRMPCCAHEEIPDLALAAPDCCNTTACVESPDAKSQNVSMLNPPATTIFLVDTATIREAAPFATAALPLPPPPLRLRLAVISTLLI